MKIKLGVSWLLRIVASVILLQTLYFKFSAHPESVALFSKLGVEPWGRICTGVIELIAGILLIIPATAIIGALMGIGLMAGAILSHITILGIASKGDGGQLFMLAIVVFVSCLVVLILHREDGKTYIQKLFKKNKLQTK